MTAITLTIPGAPTGKGRPQFNRSTGHARTPQVTKVAEARVLTAWQAAGCPRLPDGPVGAYAEMHLARPGNHFRVNGELSAAGLRSEYPTKTPDVDNVLKLIMDALNKCAYRDDACIVTATITKRWCQPGEREHTDVHLRSMVPDVEELAA